MKHYSNIPELYAFSNIQFSYGLTVDIEINWITLHGESRVQQDNKREPQRWTFALVPERRNENINK